MTSAIPDVTHVHDHAAAFRLQRWKRGARRQDWCYKIDFDHRANFILVDLVKPTGAYCTRVVHQDVETAQGAE